MFVSAYIFKIEEVERLLLIILREVANVTKYTGLWDVKFTWYYLSVTRQNWSLTTKSTNLGLPDLAWLLRFLKRYQISSTTWLLYCDRVYLHLSYENVFSIFRGVMAQFEPVKHNFPN